MRTTFLAFLFYILTFYVTAAQTYKQSMSELTLPHAFFGGEQSRFAWLNMPGLFPHASISHGHTRLLPIKLNSHLAKQIISVADENKTFGAYVNGDDRIDSILVLHRGQVVYQEFKSHTPYQRHITWSVTKVITAAALAVLEQQGKVDIASPIKRYLPQLANSKVGHIPLLDIVDMSSGIDCRDSDGYQNPETCVYLTDVVFDIMPADGGKNIKLESLINNVGIHRPHGQETEYTSLNTLLLGWVIESITNKPLVEALSELIWQPMGAEADALMLINKQGEAYASGGISARLHDIARFGLLYVDGKDSGYTLPGEHIDDLQNTVRPLISPTLMKNYQRLFKGDVPLHSRWQWDLIWEDGDMYKDGFSGQGIYISPKNNMVAVWFGTADKLGRKHYLLPIMRELANSGVFLKQ